MKRFNLINCAKFTLKLSLFSFFLFALSACATYQNKVGASRTLLKNGQTEEALEKLKALAEVPGDDQLVYLLDYGMALQIAGKYKESTQAFLKADKLVDVNDFHSVSNIAAATLGSETMIQYKGESYEKYLINCFLAINFLMMGDPDAAMVEVRRVNEKIQKMKMDGREPYELNPFAKYLSALIYESDRKYDDAYIAFNESYKLDNGNNTFLPEDLIRSAKKARREDAYDKWKKEFPHIKEDPSWYNNDGELVIIYQQGWGPEKHMSRDSHRFPTLMASYSDTQAAKLMINGKAEATSQGVYSVEKIAIKTLQEDYGALVARRVGGIAAKAIVADQIRQKNELLGSIAWIAMNVADQADLRQWSTLPANIQMIRVRLKPGKYKISLQGLGAGGNITADQMPEKEIVIASNRKTFINWRSLR